MISRALSELGYHVGDESEVLAAQSDNPLGYFERRDVVALNERILLEAGGNWYRPPALTKDLSYTSELAAVAESLGTQPWLIKDPRLSLTWPVWSKAFPDCCFVYVYRSPEAVARSLESRNGFPLDYGLALWEYYNRKILGHLRGQDFVAVCYEDFAADSEGQLNRIASLVTHNSSTHPAIDIFKTELNNTPDNDSLQTIAELKTPAQRFLEASCRSIVEGGEIPDSVELIDGVLLTRLRSMGDALVHSAQARQVRNQFDVMKDEFAALQDAHETGQKELSFLRDRFADPDETVNQLAVSKDRITALRAELREATTQNEKTRDELVRTVDERDRFLGERDAFMVQRNTVIEELDSTQHSLVAEQGKSQQLSEDLAHVTRVEQETNQQLGHVYDQLRQFSASKPGSLVRLVLGAYKWVTLRPSGNTALDDVMNMAAHTALVAQNPVPAASSSRLSAMLSIISYGIRHPYSSVRSFSLHRLRRMLQVIFRGPKADLDLWVTQRFPDAVGPSAEELNIDQQAELDQLSLQFEVPETPLVSIVVPVHNQYRVTMNCLRSLLETSCDASFEIILADDASSDLTVSIAERVSGVSIVRSEENRGFLGNCNEAARYAKGEYLLLLNNDTAVTSGWLDQLLVVFDQFPDAGVVGPKLLYGDGRLQEAGGIVWRDASGWNYGRMDDAAAPSYNYLRRVDYISGACLLTRRSIWEQLGGFDSRYTPAYYEDTDFCFAVRDAGYEVYYQPHSEVYHFEGISHGTDENSGIKRYQAVNRAAFRDKWRDVLDAGHYDNAEHVFQARDRSRRARCVLVVDHYVPSFDKDAGSRSTMMYLELMVALGYNVKFLGANFFPHQPYTAALQALGIEVLYGEAMARNIGRWLRESAPYIDAIYLHRPHIAEQFLDLLTDLEPQPPIIYFGHDLHYLRTGREAELRGTAELASEAENWKQREFAVFDRVDTIYYPSSAEVAAINREREDLHVRAIPLFVADQMHQATYKSEGREGLLFVGGFNHPPNVDGVEWLVRDILPLARAQAPELVVHIVGSNAPDSVAALCGQPGICFHGYLTDAELADLYQSVRGVVVPLRFGAGVKGKVIEAMQWGLPLVTTSIGAEGLPFPDAVFECADAPQQFAEAMLSIHQGEPSALARLDNFPEYLTQHFGSDVIRTILEEDFGSPVKGVD